MAGIDQGKIFTGAPNQTKVVGAILRAPLGTALPDGIDDAPDSAFVGGGYVSDKGLALTPELSTKDIKDWSLAVVRKLIESFTNTLEWAHIETSKESLGQYFGDGNVTEVAAANSQHGQQLKARLNKEEMPHGSYLFRIKDGPRRMMVVVPDGQVTKREKIEFLANQETRWGVALSTFEDENGDHVIIYTDDGQKTTV